MTHIYLLKVEIKSECMVSIKLHVAKCSISLIICCAVDRTVSRCLAFLYYVYSLLDAGSSEAMFVLSAGHTQSA